MRKTTLTAALCALALLVSAPAARAEDDAVYAKLMAEKAPAVVAVKVVLTVKISGMGQSREQEVKNDATGVVVDPSGLVMLQGSALDASMGIPPRFRDQISIKSVPTSIRVIFPGDTKEYDAILGAKDSKLGLAFILIRDLGDKKPTAVSMEALATPKIGQTLYSVDRLDQGFDYAPMVSRAKVAGRVSKPRDMWIVQGAAGAMGMPLYDAAGSVAGIMVSQQGVGEESQTRPFLLPIDKAVSTIERSLGNAREELDRVLEEEEDAAARAAEEKAKADAEKADAEKADGEKGDGEKGDGKADEPKKDAPAKEDGDE